ncbi:MAG: hypothetical protein KAT77_04360 [Nanoarchaeota archaeon]|nr:hypothetical protein [Nanoarchaeota archaeon]
MEQMEPKNNVFGERKPTGQRPKIKIEVDENECFFRRRDITIHEVKYLLKYGYKKVYTKSIVGKKKELYLVKPPANEGLEHFFLVRDIGDYLKKLKIDFKTYQTVKPDIIFEIQNKKVAIEIESGSVLRDHKKRFLEKVNTNDENFGENWFFVVTNRNLLKKYRKFGRTFTRKRVVKALERYDVFEPYY